MNDHDIGSAADHQTIKRRLACNRHFKHGPNDVKGPEEIIIPDIPANQKGNDGLSLCMRFKIPYGPFVLSFT